MYCIKCNTKMKCMDSYQVKEEYTTYRRYKCPKCKALTYTEEYVATDEDAKGKIYYAKKKMDLQRGKDERIQVT